MKTNIYKIKGNSPVGFSGGDPKAGDLAKTSDGKMWLYSEGSGGSRNLSNWSPLQTPKIVFVTIPSVITTDIVLKSNEVGINAGGYTLSGGTLTLNGDSYILTL